MHYDFDHEDTREGIESHFVIESWLSDSDSYSYSHSFSNLYNYLIKMVEAKPSTPLLYPKVSSLSEQ